MTTVLPDIGEHYRQFCTGSLADPYPFLHHLRASDPVHWSESLNAWILTRYDDVYAAHLDKRLVSGRIDLNMQALPSEHRGNYEALGRHVSNWLGFTDPPKHTRMRKLVLKAFTPRVVQAMRERIQSIVDALFDGFKADDAVDVVNEFAFPLPATVICEMLGIPVAARDRFRSCAEDMTAFVGGVGELLVVAAQRADKSFRQIVSFFSELIAERRAAPANDLLTALVHVKDEGLALTDDEIIGMSVFLFVAGHETTASLLGNGLLALAQHPEHYQLLRRDRSLVSSAIEEFLRIESPIQLNTRLASDDITLRGRHIESGQGVILMLSAANRDPEEFPDPDRLVFTRQDNPHLAFGHGIHFCLGAPLARLEADIAFNTFLDRYERLRLAANKLNWRQDMTLRCLTSLPLKLCPS